MPHPHMTAEDLYNIVSLSDPRFSPGGGRLAYVSTRIDRESNGYTSAICIAWVDAPSPDAQGTASARLRQFTNGDKRDSAPRWSPCGRWLAFVSDRGDKRAKPQIYLIPTDGGEARKLTEMENGAGEPTWSPDGRQLAFTSRANAEELAAEDEPQPGTPPDPDEAKRRAEEKEKAEEEKADPASSTALHTGPTPATMTTGRRTSMSWI